MKPGTIMTVSNHFHNNHAAVGPALDVCLAAPAYMEDLALLQLVLLVLLVLVAVWCLQAWRQA
jgi:hypothetical protein